MSAITLQFDTAADFEAAISDALQNNEGAVPGIAAYVLREQSRDAGGAAPSADSDGGAELPQVDANNSGLAMKLADGREVRARLSVDGGSVCFDLTATNAAHTKIALSFEAIESMRLLANRLAAAQECGEAVAPEAKPTLTGPISIGHSDADGWYLKAPYVTPEDARQAINLLRAPPPAPPAPLPGKESAFLSAVATIYIDPHDERQELEYIGHIPRGELIRLYKAPNAVHADLLNVAIAVRDACHKAWVTIAENWRADVDVKSIVSAALSSPPAQAAPADYPPLVSKEQLLQDLGYFSPSSARLRDAPEWQRHDRLRRFIEQSGRSGVSADPLPCPQPSAQGPAELWLQLHGDCHESEFTQPVDYTSEDVTWCWHRIHESDVRYVRADTDMQAEIDRMSDALREIGDFAHDRSTGPAAPDALWEVRSMAYSAESNITSPQHQVKKGESS